MILNAPFLKRFLLLTTAAMLAACGGTSTVTSNTHTNQQFGNFVVIGIAGDYDARAHFERQVVSQLRNTGASASPWYSVIGGNKPITQEDVVNAIAKNEFDSVIAVRRLDSSVDMEVHESRTKTDSRTIGGRVVNLFRSDYIDYTVPATIDLSAQVTLAIDVYDAAAQEIVFSFDHQTRKETDLGLLIDDTAETIVKRIDREKLIAR